MTPRYLTLQFHIHIQRQELLINPFAALGLYSDEPLSSDAGLGHWTPKQ
jgi:hypothetical protein